MLDRFDPSLDPWSAWLTFHLKHVKRGPDYFLTNRAYFDWAFLLNPYNPTPGEYQFALYYDNRDIVGYIGRIWSPILVKGAERRCLWQETSFVRPDYRGKGIGTELYTWVAGSDITGNIQGERQPQVDRVLEKTIGSYQRRECMERAVLPASKFAGVPDPYHLLTSTQTLDGLRMREADVSWQAAALWNTVARRYGTSTNRTVQWLRWRFIDHPVGGYQIFAVEGGVAILRREAAYIRIVDVWGTEEGVKHVLCLVVDYAAATKAEGVDFLCAGWPDWDAFEALGFERWKGAEMNQWPMLFNPVDTSVREEQVTLYGAGVPQDGPWYITRADDGRDRP